MKRCSMERRSERLLPAHRFLRAEEDTLSSSRESLSSTGAAVSDDGRRWNSSDDSDVYFSPVRRTTPTRNESFGGGRRRRMPSRRCSTAERLAEAYYLGRPEPSGASTTSSPAELYSRIRKPPPPVPSSATLRPMPARKRVCFRETFSLSSIKEISPIASTSKPVVSAASSSGQGSSSPEAATADSSSPDAHPLPPPPVPSPTPLYRSPAKPVVPKTNPYYAGNTPSKVIC